MIKVGVIGYGYWGPNLVRNFMEAPGATVAAVCDLHTERLGPLQLRYPTIKTTNDTCELFNDPSLDAIVIATPVSSHFELAMAALRADKQPRQSALIAAADVSAPGSTFSRRTTRRTLGGIRTGKRDHSS